MFLQASQVAQLVKHPSATQETPGSFLNQEDSPGEGRGCPLQYSWVSLVAQMVKNPPVIGRPGFNPRVGEIPWRRAWQPAPVFWPGEAPGQRSLAGHSPCGHNELDTTERLTHLFLPVKFVGTTSFLQHCWFVPLGLERTTAPRMLNPLHVVYGPLAL